MMTIVKDMGYFLLKPSHKQKKHYVEASCDRCGKIRIVSLQHAKSSRGCLKCFNVGNGNRKHGETKTKLYMRYAKMKDRCCNKNAKDYKDYGGRGITVCQEWRDDFMVFKKWAVSAGYKDNTKLTIERVENDKGYSPTNCIFTTRKKQSENQRLKKNSINGQVGVIKNPRNNKWYAKLRHNGVIKQFGGFNTVEEGIKAREDYIIQHNLKLRLNLPKKTEQ